MARRRCENDRSCTLDVGARITCESTHTQNQQQVLRDPYAADFYGIVEYINSWGTSRVGV